MATGGITGGIVGRGDDISGGLVAGSSVRGGGGDDDVPMPATMGGSGR